MSVLLRHPAAVPALFSRGLEPDEGSIRRRKRGRAMPPLDLRLRGSEDFGWPRVRSGRGRFVRPPVAVLLAELPLAAAAALTLGPLFPH